ncbi:MAG: hypothetical protein ACLR8Y_00020 [Alistipes indistinctus]
MAYPSSAIRSTAVFQRALVPRQIPDGGLRIRRSAARDSPGERLHLGQQPATIPPHHLLDSIDQFDNAIGTDPQRRQGRDDACYGEALFDSRRQKAKRSEDQRPYDRTAPLRRQSLPGRRQRHLYRQVAVRTCRCQL